MTRGGAYKKVTRLHKELFLKKHGYALILVLLSPLWFAGCSDADKTTREALRAELAGYPEISGAFEQGVATLSGSAPGEEEKETVMDAVRNIPGVGSVNGNRLRVVKPERVVVEKESLSEAGASGATKETVSDADITDAVKKRHLSQKELSALDIGVKTSGGVVTLSGYVGDSAQIRQAEVAAKEIRGVKNVINYLSVKM